MHHFNSSLMSQIALTLVDSSVSHCLTDNINVNCSVEQFLSRPAGIDADII